MSVLVLASASAARARLLADAGIAADCDPAAIDEGAIKQTFRREGRTAADCAARLAEAKALAVAALHPDRLVLGADQLLDCDGDWLDKPTDIADARRQLGMLRGRDHTLVTAAAVVRNRDVLWRALAEPRVTMRCFSDAFLEHYLTAMGERVLRTVGGYEFEGLGAQLIAKIVGDYFAVLGLPLLPLMDFLRDAGALPS